MYRRVARYAVGRTSPVPYTLVDMADDAKALLDHLQIDRAHVVGASMGGMIAQVLAGNHPDRVCGHSGIIMSSSGKAVLGAAAVAGDQAGVRRAGQGRAVGGTAGVRSAQHLDHQRPQLPSAR